MKPSDLPDSDLVKRVARRDGDALAVLYDRHAARVFGLCLRILAEPQMAEDVLQEVFVRVWERADSFEQTRGNFTAWLMGITRNTCIDQLRRLRARPQPAEVHKAEEALPVEEVLPDPRADVPEAAAVHERATLVRQALGTLTREQRLVIELSYFRGLTRREIATRLDWPEGTVHTRARLALLNLRQKLVALGLNPDDLA